MVVAVVVAVVFQGEVWRNVVVLYAREMLSRC
jgi:hypothetical protein